MLSAEAKAKTFANHLRGRQIPGYDPRLYTHQELIRLADDFLKRTIWTDEPEELVALFRKYTGRKASATRKVNTTRRQAAKHRTDASTAQGDLFLRT